MVLAETLDSILNQTYKNWECLLIDDGSTDDSYKIAQQYEISDSRFIADRRPHGRLKGANACRNHGIDLSSGDYLLWLDSDDLLLPDYLSKKVTHFKNTGCDVVISKSQHFNHPDPSDIFFNDELNYKFADNPISALNFAKQLTLWLTSDLMVARRVIKNKRWNEFLPKGQEVNFFLQILEPDLKIEFLDEYLVSKRWHPESITAQRKPSEASNYAITLRVESLNDVLHSDKNELKDWLFKKILLATARDRNIRSLREEKLIFRIIINHGGAFLFIKYYFSRLLKWLTNRNERLVKSFFG